MSVVLITGASRGIGAACANLFAANGSRIGVNYTKGKAAADAVVAGIPARKIKELDPEMPMRTRLDLVGDIRGVSQFMDNAYREELKGNSTLA